MKKLKRIISTIILTLSPFAALAGNGSAYFKGMIGANKLNDIKNFNNLKQKASFAPEMSIGAGAGFNFSDTLRADILVSYTTVYFYNSRKLITFYDTHLNSTESTINSTIFNVYKDVFNLDEDVSVFVGAGAGISQINESIRWEVFFPDKKNPNNIITAKGDIYRKTVYNFTYSLIGGLNFKVTPQLNIEIAYNFKDHGLTSSKMIGKVHLRKKHYKGHSIYTGIRFNT